MNLDHSIESVLVSGRPFANFLAPVHPVVSMDPALDAHLLLRGAPQRIVSLGADASQSFREQQRKVKLVGHPGGMLERVVRFHAAVHLRLVKNVTRGRTNSASLSFLL